MKIEKRVMSHGVMFRICLNKNHIDFIVRGKTERDAYINMHLFYPLLEYKLFSLMEKEPEIKTVNGTVISTWEMTND